MNFEATVPFIAIGLALAGYFTYRSRTRSRIPDDVTCGSPAEFWQWFAANSDALLAVQTAREPICDRLWAMFRCLDPNLVFAFGPVSDGRREFVVSADGVRSAFPAVRKLVDTAPDLPQWKIIAFRPRIGTGVEANIGGIKIGPDSLWFSAQPQGDRVALVIHVKDVPAVNENVMSAVYLKLDCALGEHDVVTKIGTIDIVKLDGDPAELGLQPFVNLPNAVDLLAP